ncbi:MAG TPA: M23 family metallopeptidase [Thermoanaerobaculia bacterium]|nr:M23 family metallopeptidase [Thermoanaerobaculia bacterium]
MPARRRPLKRRRRTALLLLGLGGLALLFLWQAPRLAQAARVVRLLRSEPARVLPVPVEGISPGDLEETWGAPRSGGRRHEGIDILAPRGALVVSATPGLLVKKGWNNLGGWAVTVLGPGGERHYYAHLEEFAPPEEGDWVDVGEVLGFVGDTGNAKGTPTHLHYGIYSLWGKAQDPYPRLAPEGRRTRP